MEKNNGKVLDLVMKREFAEDILEGYKHVEFRDCTPFYAKKILEKDECKNWLKNPDTKNVPFKDFETIHFHNYNNTWFLDVEIGDMGVVPLMNETILMMHKHYSCCLLDEACWRWEKKLKEDPNDMPPLCFYFEITDIIDTNIEEEDDESLEETLKDVVGDEDRKYFEDLIKEHNEKEEFHKKMIEENDLDQVEFWIPCVKEQARAIKNGEITVDCFPLTETFMNRILIDENDDDEEYDDDDSNRRLIKFAWLSYEGIDYDMLPEEDGELINIREANFFVKVLIKDMHMGAFNEETKKVLHENNCHNFDDCFDGRYGDEEFFFFIYDEVLDSENLD